MAGTLDSCPLNSGVRLIGVVYVLSEGEIA